MVAGLFGVGLLAAAITGCGPQEQEPSNPPVFEDATIDCDDSEGDRVVETVAITVTDPERDLIIPEEGLEGTFNGLAIRLTPADTSQRFSWAPPEESEGIACNRQHDLAVDVEDADGNTATFDQRIDKSGSS